MGYFKQQEIAQQERIDSLVAWYKYHEPLLPAPYFKWLLGQDELLWKAVEQWEQSPPPESVRREVIRSRSEMRARRRRRRTALVAVIVISLVVIGVFVWGWVL